MSLYFLLLSFLSCLLLDGFHKWSSGFCCWAAKGAEWGAGLGGFSGCRSEDLWCGKSWMLRNKGCCWMWKDVAATGGTESFLVGAAVEEAWRSSLEQAGTWSLLVRLCVSVFVFNQTYAPAKQPVPASALGAGKSCSQDIYFLLWGAELLIVQQVYHSQGFRLSQSSLWFSENEILDLVTVTDPLCLFSEKTSEFSTALISQPSSVGAAALWSQKMHFRILTL